MPHPQPHPYWPLFDLEIRTPMLTQRYPDDPMLSDLVALAARGIHDPDTMPFATPWTRFDSPDLERNALRFHWRTRADTTPENFRIPLAAIVDDRVVGMSDLVTENYPVLRQFETGSWLGREFQGRGIGSEMRRATLSLGFDGLGAEVATTTAYVDNPASLGVTRSLGYTQSSTQRFARQRSGIAEADGTEGVDIVDLLGFTMDRSHFDTLRRSDISIHGIDAVRELLGIS